MATEAEAAAQVATIMTPLEGAAGGPRLQPAFEAELLAWFNTGLQVSQGACTFTDAGDLVGDVGHGLVAGDAVEFLTIVTTTGISINTEYYVIAAGLTADAFSVSATVGGAALTLTTNGTGTYAKKRYKSADAVTALLNAGYQDGDYQTTEQVILAAETILAAG